MTSTCLQAIIFVTSERKFPTLLSKKKYSSGSLALMSLRSNRKYLRANNFTNKPKFHKFPSSLRDFGNFVRTLEIRVMIILIIFGSFSVRSVCCYIHYALRNIRLFPPPFLIKVDFQCRVSFSVLYTCVKCVSNFHCRVKISMFDFSLYSCHCRRA